MRNPLKGSALAVALTSLAALVLSMTAERPTMQTSEVWFLVLGVFAALWFWMDCFIYETRAKGGWL